MLSSALSHSLLITHHSSLPIGDATVLIKEVFLQAVYALGQNRFRASLTLLGIAWGIVTVVILMAYGNGFHNALIFGFRGAFSDGTVVIWPGQTSLQAGGERAGRRIQLKEEDVDAIK